MNVVLLFIGWFLRDFIEDEPLYIPGLGGLSTYGRYVVLYLVGPAIVAVGCVRFILNLRDMLKPKESILESVLGGSLIMLFLFDTYTSLYLFDGNLELLEFVLVF